MVLHDWQCPRHGVFESTHGICPHMGCTSDGVTMVFLKAPSIGSQATRRRDERVKEMSDRMGVSDFRTTKEEGDRSFRGLAPGQENRVLWGNEAVSVFGGASGMMQQAASAEAATRAFAKQRGLHDTGNGMRTTATDLGLTRRVLPPAKVIPEPTK